MREKINIVMFFMIKYFFIFIGFLSASLLFMFVFDYSVEHLANLEFVKNKMSFDFFIKGTLISLTFIIISILINYLLLKKKECWFYKY